MKIQTKELWKLYLGLCGLDVLFDAKDASCGSMRSKTQFQKLFENSKTESSYLTAGFGLPWRELAVVGGRWKRLERCTGIAVRHCERTLVGGGLEKMVSPARKQNSKS